MLTSSGLFINNHGPYEFTMETNTELIDVTSLGGNYIVDPEWFTIDRKGHFHAYDVKSDSLPTLKAVTEHVPEYDPDGLEPRTHYECLICNEVIEPNLVISDKRATIAGPTLNTILVSNYRGSIDVGDRVSFYTVDYFGFARVTNIHCSATTTGINVEVDMMADFIARKGTPVDL